LVQGPRGRNRRKKKRGKRKEYRAGIGPGIRGQGSGLARRVNKIEIK